MGYKNSELIFTHFSMEDGGVNVPEKPFRIPIKTPEEAYKYSAILAAYDCYLQNNHMKNEYVNAQSIQERDNEDLCGFHWDGIYYEDLDDYELDIPKSDEIIEFEKEVLSQVHFD